MLKNQPAQHFGLLGRKLGHSWSKIIHEKLGSAPYELIELEPHELEDFVRKGSWSGLNVTIPYKKDVVSFAHELSCTVQAIGAANTLVKDASGRIFADNTDVLGAQFLFERFFEREYKQSAQSALRHKKVLVFGTGGAYLALRYVLEKSFGAHVVAISRSGENNYGSVEEKHADCALIVNATPCGMFPNCPESPLDEATLAQLNQLLGVVDIIYNPLNTKLMLDAERLGIPCENGLSMLVAQAFFASEQFQAHTLDQGLIEDIEDALIRRLRNIVLIGMPGSGKSTCAKKLARMMGRPFVDLDDAIQLSDGRHPKDIITQDGEDAFRLLETEVARNFCSQSGLVVACGGGIVTQDRNRDIIRQNAVVVFLDRVIDELSLENRPLSQMTGIETLAEQRLWLYKDWSDISLACTGSAEGDAKALFEMLA